MSIGSDPFALLFLLNLDHGAFYYRHGTASSNGDPGYYYGARQRIDIEGGTALIVNGNTIQSPQPPAALKI